MTANTFPSPPGRSDSLCPCSCNHCYGVCPDNAVIKLVPEKQYEIDLDYCIGCGLCAAECPCGAIEMVPEEI
jgi:Pyruvate/2-oxoacid:ferredoxin oxidoreductase delta subunit